MDAKPPPKISAAIAVNPKPVPELMLELEQDVCGAYGLAKDIAARLDGMAEATSDVRTAAHYARNIREVLEQVVHLTSKARREAISAGV